MTTPINLNKFRKAKLRAQKEKQAAENRTTYGLTKIEKQKMKFAKEKADKIIQGHKRDKEGDHEPD